MVEGSTGNPLKWFPGPLSSGPRPICSVHRTSAFRSTRRHRLRHIRQSEPEKLRFSGRFLRCTISFVVTCEDLDGDCAGHNTMLKSWPTGGGVITGRAGASKGLGTVP
ncbi:Selenide, water dikinase [Gossypium arboreum]|uniref:Selenide, water dikinase n=1 Tax=Gossypium arboreum TaxID=29729 RepID=A0A0B0MTI6_GOSAR|nr:Selenide, water dikinase [Gossypium arboreum]